MNPLDLDMELLRRLGTFRTAVGSLSDADGPDRALSALVSLRRRAEEAGTDALGALDAMASAITAEALDPAEADRLSTDLASVLDALDPIFTGAEDPQGRVTLEAALAVLGKGDGASRSPSPGSSEDESLHSVAAYLIQMEPTLLKSIETLRDRFAETVGQWTGSDEARTQLALALGELDAVAGNRRSKKARRVEVVERVGEVIEIAMREEEDGIFPVDPGASTGDGEAAEPGSPVEAHPEPLNTLMAGALQAPPSPVPTTAANGLPATVNSDPELVSDFVTEGLDYLDQAEEALLILEAHPDDKESVNVTFRAFHTIKGVSAFLELDQITSIAHEAETLLSQVREGSLRFTETAAELFLRSADVLRGLLEGIREILGGGSASTPPGLDQVLAALADPDLAKKVANNEPLDFQRAAPTVEAGSPADKGEASTGGDESVRVRTERLDALVDLVGELVVAYSMVAQDPDVVQDRGDLRKKVGQSSKIIRELQDLSTSLRMVPLKPAFHKISRVVRDVAKKSGKKVTLIALGDETELDRSMVGVITDPLVHMVRNSIDHGIEAPADRLAAGKPERGIVRLTALQSGGSVVVTIEDDGKGLDKEKLLAKAIDRGIIESDRNLTDSEVFNLVFHPGLSTAAKVTDISGRGVGMDVVKRAVESLRGRIEIQSEPGKGTKFSIHLPLTLSITDGMLVRIGEERFIVPTMKIQLSLRPTEKDIWSVSGRGEMVMLHGQLIPIARLHRIFGLQGSIEDPTRALLVVVGEGSRRTALLVDELLGQQQFVVKPLTGQVADTPGVAGGAILGDGGVGLILDPEELIELARGSRFASVDAA